MRTVSSKNCGTCHLALCVLNDIKVEEWQMQPPVYYYPSATANMRGNYTAMHEICHCSSSVRK